ncbi:hypothetical protein R6G85_04435 [Actinotignum urinale]|uniref:Uncharacterized protein n=1 Tax=Actinotignum urinale TaxID=190146 RepID=A0AAW9HU40_9ACTO|nr:hypothetical protein [Actinotignum urinale]MDY5129335.1 hypothetical protein [Actinotignum urinale]MDY5133282.1 hypothetical protein [Actinotignum urinale]MDY5151732.1 hypothetical protein [Actinotignum urinale]MDY5154379.1 hypothetical protein [Actinotignum urinale]WIK59723.1 hypothetical protein CJ184_003560 [Actinotignum urinale]
MHIQTPTHIVVYRYVSRIASLFVVYRRNDSQLTLCHGVVAMNAPEK